MSFWSRLPEGRLLVELSLWSANLAELGSEVRRMAPHVDLFHIDVADGHFVPQLLFFPDLVAALRRYTDVPLHVHLMVDNPAALAADFASAGADLITIHVETATQATAAIDVIHGAGKAVGLAVGLQTDPSVLTAYLNRVDAIVAIGTPLGTRGTVASSAAPQRMALLHGLRRGHERSREIKIVADGGIRRTTVPGLVGTGADSVVAGSLVFADPDPVAAVYWLRTFGTPE
jgi:ribulose-phosphate 3-epimerase